MLNNRVSFFLCPMERRTTLKIEKCAHAYEPSLDFSLVVAQPGRDITGTPLVRMMQDVMAGDGPLYYVHEGSMLSLVSCVRMALGSDVYGGCCNDMTTLLQISQTMEYARTDAERAFWAIIGCDIDLAPHMNNAAVIEAVHEYLTADEYALKRAHITRLSVFSGVWSGVLQHIFNSPGCLPALDEIVIAMGADAVRVPLPVRVRSLEWHADDDVDTDWARETVANAVGLGVLTDNTRVCDYANKTVYCVNSTCEVFAGCFPNARLLYLGGRVTSVDLTRCPNIERVRIRDMSPELYTAVLLTAPRIPTRPIAAGVYD